MEKAKVSKKKGKRRSLSSVNANAAGIDIGATFMSPPCRPAAARNLSAHFAASPATFTRSPIGCERRLRSGLF